MKYENYRKIWIKHNGPIPKDFEGRSFEIHHIDGDKSNNDISNLRCISIREHYWIHWFQGDSGACLSMHKRMKLSSIEKSGLSRDAAFRKIKNGTHHFLDKEKAKERAIKNNKKRVETGTHNWCGPKHNLTMIKKGLNPWVGPSTNLKMLSTGKHPSQQKGTCIYCNKTMDVANISRWHNENCKYNK